MAGPISAYVYEQSNEHPAHKRMLSIAKSTFLCSHIVGLRRIVRMKQLSVRL